MSRELGMQLHEELDRREKLAAQLNEEIEALKRVLGIIERPTPEAHNRVTKVVGRKSRVNGKANGHAPNACEKHPSAKPRRDGRCPKCVSAEYQREYQKRKKPAAETVASDRTPEAAPKPQRVQCIDCGEKFNDIRSMKIHQSRVHFGKHAEAEPQ